MTTTTTRAPRSDSPRLRFALFHKRNNSSNSSKMDQILIVCLGLLVILFSGVTVTTYAKVAHLHDASTTTTTSPHRRASHTVQQQQQANQQANDPIHTLQHMFPIHVHDDDMETIPHPGLALLDDNKQSNQQHNLLPSTMTVPKFFDVSHGHYYFNSVQKQTNDNNINNNHTIRHYLGDGRQLMEYAKAQTIGSFVTPTTDNNNNNNAAERQQPLLPTIYCSIASYRDPECTGTVADLFERAQHPERIRVAILDQRLPGSDDPVCGQVSKESCASHPNQPLCKYRHLMDYYEMNAQLAVGPVFARHLAHRFYRGEYFAMQIDSHVRFVQDWDSDICSQWDSANNEMAVLTTYLSDIINSIDPITHRGQHPGRPIMCVSDFEGKGTYKHLRHGQQPEGKPRITGQPTLHPFWAAGFSFARGHFVIQVPYDQYLPMVFQGEEISIGLRGFSYGYDYYAPESSVCFHMYAIKENKAKRKAVPLFWENGNRFRGVGERAMKRLNSIIHMSDRFAEAEWDTKEVHKYGLGQVRNVDTFFKVFGIHVQEQRVENHLCRFVGQPMMKTFLPALRKNKMGLDYDLIHYEFKDPQPEIKQSIQTAKKR